MHRALDVVARPVGGGRRLRRRRDATTGSSSSTRSTRRPISASRSTYSSPSTGTPERARRGAAHVWSPRRSRSRSENRGVTVTDPSRTATAARRDRGVPDGTAGEVVYWVPGSGRSSSATSCSAPARSRGRPRAAPPLPRALARSKTHDDLRARSGRCSSCRWSRSSSRTARRCHVEHANPPSLVTVVSCSGPLASLAAPRHADARRLRWHEQPAAGSDDPTAAKAAAKAKACKNQACAREDPRRHRGA